MRSTIKSDWLLISSASLFDSLTLPLLVSPSHPVSSLFCFSLSRSVRQPRRPSPFLPFCLLLQKLHLYFLFFLLPSQHKSHQCLHIIGLEGCGYRQLSHFKSLDREITHTHTKKKSKLSQAGGCSSSTSHINLISNHLEAPRSFFFFFIKATPSFLIFLLMFFGGGQLTHAAG